MDNQVANERKPKGYYVDYSLRGGRFGPRRGGPQRAANTTNNARYKEVPDISFGQRGFLITSVDEVKCYLEMRNLLESYFHEIYDQEETTESKSSELVEDELEGELKKLRITRPFKQVKTHCRNSIFINIVKNFAHINPVTIVDRFFDELAEKREIRTSNTNRVLPILDTFRNSVSCAKESIAKLLKESFNDHETRCYFIEFQTRGNYKLESDDKQKMIEGVAESITQLRPNWRVSRDNADYIVILVALRHVCCITILSDYFKRSKYNVIEFCKDFTPRESRYRADLEERHLDPEMSEPVNDKK